MQRFSNPDNLYSGSPIGNAANDNARVHNDVRETVAAYYSEPTLCTGVDCSSFGDQCNVGTCDPTDGSCFADPVAK